MSFIEQHILDPDDLASIITMPDHWDYTQYINQYVEDNGIPTLRDLSGLNSAGLADKMKVIKAFAIERAEQLTAVCYTLVDVATAISGEATILISESGLQLSQISADAAAGLLALIRQIGSDLSLSISNQAGDFFNFVHAATTEAIQQAEVTWNALPYCVDYPNFKVLLGNGLHESSALNDYKLENVILAYDIETGSIWFNTTLRSLENHVSQAILDLDRQLLEQRGVFSLMAKVVDCLKNPSDVVGAIKAAAEEMFSELFGDIAELYNGCISTYNNYGIGGVICYLIDYLKQGRDLVDNNGRIAFTNNAKYKTSSWLAGCVATAFTAVATIVNIVVAMFNPVIGALLATVTTVISTLAGAINYNKDELQNAKIEPEAELSGFPYGVVSTYAMSETLYAMCENSPVTIDVPGGYFILSKYDQQDKIVSAELHVTPNYAGGSFSHLWNYLTIKGVHQFEGKLLNAMFKYRQFIVDGSDPHALDIESDLPNLYTVDYNYYASLNPEQLDKALLFTFCFNLAIAYYYMAAFISNRVGKPLSPLDAADVSIDGNVSADCLFRIVSGDQSMGLNRLKPCAALSCAFFILLNSTEVHFGSDPVANFDLLVSSSGIRPSWINVSDNSSILDNTLHLRVIGNTNIFGAGLSNLLAESISKGDDGNYNVHFKELGSLYLNDYSLKDTLYPGISWKSGWCSLMLEHSSKKYNVYQLLTANGYVVSTPKYDRNTYTASVVLASVVITAVVATVAIVGFTINAKLKNLSSTTVAKAEQAWENFKKDPTEANRKAYRKAVRKNNILAKFGFGTALDKYNYWGGESASGEADGNLDSYFEQVNKKLDGNF